MFWALACSGRCSIDSATRRRSSRSSPPRRAQPRPADCRAGAASASPTARSTSSATTRSARPPRAGRVGRQHSPRDLERQRHAGRLHLLPPRRRGERAQRAPRCGGAWRAAAPRRRGVSAALAAEGSGASPRSSVASPATTHRRNSGQVGEDLPNLRRVAPNRPRRKGQVERRVQGIPPRNRRLAA